MHGLKSGNRGMHHAAGLAVCAVVAVLMPGAHAYAEKDSEVELEWGEYHNPVEDCIWDCFWEYEFKLYFPGLCYLVPKCKSDFEYCMESCHRLGG